MISLHLTQAELGGDPPAGERRANGRDRRQLPALGEPPTNGNGHRRHLRAWVWALITAATIGATSRAWVHGWEMATLPGRVDQLEAYRGDELRWRAQHVATEAAMEELNATQEEILAELRKRKR